jgi:uncharacterized protein with HEPN domain
MPRDKERDKLFLSSIVDTAQNIAERFKNVSRSEFDANPDLRDATAYRIQTIGEAASRISTEFRENHPEVPWPRVIGMRHRIVHDYMDIDYDVVWEVSTRNDSELIEILEPIVRKWEFLE